MTFNDIQGITNPQQAYDRIQASDGLSENEKSWLMAIWLKRNGWCEVPNGSKVPAGYTELTFEI